ncbi:dihydroorotase [Lachnoclostridium phytofermentans]|uniref:Dihydroorotase n=1 Tax=Lachnoclostridium phytofermentans (strain ATCC 700394 / DSM 18823 / ISDg) TaxID=357809 RepID=A9KLD8_LACP7|nr:dihydroorotase [Lachnoclostridium phytofermentans]ABX41267.1 dihydroorotase, multifunctional complex type [Lachnoclostridium phytofermentans ISDg]
MKVLIKNGFILDPATKTEGRYDLLIENKIISKVAENIEEPEATVIDASGKYVMPGFIDLHVHLREPGFEHKETIKTGAMAAAAGGYTTICPMPNTNPAIDSKAMVELLNQKAKSDAKIHIIPVGAVTVGQMGKELADIDGMAKAGALAFSEDGKSVMDVLLYVEGLKAVKDAGCIMFAHCEDKQLVRNGAMNAGKKAEELNLRGITNAVEDVITARDIFLAGETGAKLHLCHCSTKASVALVKMAKELGIDVTAEVCPHHFILSDEDIPGDDANYKMNPPLRSKEDIQALKEGLKNNVMEVISTDHAPHGEEEKKNSMSKAPFGIVGSETAFSLTYTELVQTGYLTPMQMVEKMSYNPARILGIEKGSLEPGKMADIVIADFDKEYEIDATKFYSKGKNTPFHGRKVCGKVMYTIAAGAVVYQVEE